MTCISNIYQEKPIVDGADVHLGSEHGGLLGGVVLGVGGDKATLQLLDRDVLNVEANVVAGGSLGQRLMVHLHRLDLSRQAGRSKDHHHAGLQDTRIIMSESILGYILPGCSLPRNTATSTSVW